GQAAVGSETRCAGEAAQQHGAAGRVPAGGLGARQGQGQGPAEGQKEEARRFEQQFEQLEQLQRLCRWEASERAHEVPGVGEEGHPAKLGQRSSGDLEEDFDHGGAVKKKERMPKEEAVSQLLCRWWYSLPDWPPQEESYYQEKLSSHKPPLKKVRIEEWEWLDDVDKEGRCKVYELSQFRGVFRGSKGELIDPTETCPCYKNLMAWDMVKLYESLVKAYENQLLDLKNSKYPEGRLESALKADLNKYRQKLHDARAVGRR
ncbi:unnamed protein product, partial [Prorocentrum cordatum]